MSSRGFRHGFLQRSLMKDSLRRSKESCINASVDVFADEVQVPVGEDHVDPARMARRWPRSDTFRLVEGRIHGVCAKVGGGIVDVAV